MNGSLIAALQTIADFPCAAQDNMPAANMRKIARDALDSFRQHHEQAEGAQGERKAAITKFAETCPMTAESAAGGKSYDIELRRYYLLGWDDRAALEQPSQSNTVAVDRGALKMVINALRRDAEEGRAVRGEMADALEGCVQPTPAPALEQPEVTGWLVPISGMYQFFRTEDEALSERADYLSSFEPEPVDLEPVPEAQMSVAQHERIEAARVAEIEEMDGLVKRLGDLLSEVAVALRGPEPPLTRYGYADLPLRVKTLVDEHDATRARVAELEAHCIRLGQGDAERYWENRWRDEVARAGQVPEWSSAKPTVEGAYWVRGNGLNEPAVILVKLDQGELWCNLHMNNTETDFGYGYTIAQLSSEFEWFGPLAAAPVAQAGQVPEGYMLITQDQVERHATTAWECPPQSRVVLVSTLKRLHEKNVAAPQPAGGADHE